MTSSIIARIGSLFGLETSGHYGVVRDELARKSAEVIPWRDQCEIMRAYYDNNGLYSVLQRALAESGLWTPAMQPLRNPANRIVEFYSSHLWPGHLDAALPIEAEQDGISEAIQQIWRWSNWGTKKQVAARWLALFGELYIKVVSTEDRVYFQLLEPGSVTDVETDVRDFIIRCRIDVNVQTSQGLRTYTEIWDKADGTLRTWVNPWSSEPLPEDKLGAPQLEVDMMTEFGVNFIPIARAKFRDVGDDRGVSAFMPLIDKIDEANRQATRLAQMMFRYNRPLWLLLANSVDSEGRPVGGPRMVDANGNSVQGGTLTVGDDTMLEIPGQGNLQSLVPDLKYDDYLALLQDTMRELEEDAPEMGFAKLFETIGGDMSGRAIRLKMAPAIKRVEEARGNGEDAIIRANMMALTLAQEQGLPEFRALGSYENGDFDHSFTERDVWPMSEQDRAEMETAKATAVTTKIGAGWSFEKAMEEAGYNDDDIELMVTQREATVSTLQQ